MNTTSDGHHQSVTLQLPLERETTAPAAARRAVAGWLAAAGWDAADHQPSVDTAQLVTSELVTNAIRYGMEPITLTVRLISSGLRLEVHDADQRANPELQHPDDRTPGGRGLLLVSGSADEWGWHPVDNGKVVWAEIALT